MTAYLRKPFASISGDNYLDRGAGGQIFVISKRVVFKCPTKFGNPAPSQEKEMKESAEKIAHEKSVHELLMKHPHPNIVRCILCVPEGFFMERMEANLRTRIKQYSAGHVPSNRTKARWITQIASALSWIEGLGFVHGDLRPANILLTANENIRLVDFDTSVKIGKELEAVSEPFARLNKGRKIPHAGPITEQFSLGSCIYTIRFGHIPLDGLDPPDRIKKLMNNEFPSTENDVEFGDVTLSCWQGQYASVTAAYDDIKARCDGLGYDTESFPDVSEDLIHDMPSLVAECKDFISREKGSIS
ncbi:hypothetical protein E4U57_003054 [Claviceps arundinis]|uniref:EKC/KEOPS complex subunit BUD32 n=1 Tax=Claviceps arundinis TaxID=1623583 RepID=A0A9P7SQE7_9HYPO|nr:hypothetical protein E4U57_003054 [Claviceps arundinis]KAG5966636.1 hypothetical protein E4U56_001221 [Claviceps arundinis]